MEVYFDEAKGCELSWGKNGQQKYISNVIKRVRTNFNQRYYHIQEQNSPTHFSINLEEEKMCDAIWEAIIDIKDYFRFRYCRLFGNRINIGNSACSNAINRIGLCPYDKHKLIFDFEKMPLSMTHCKNTLENGTDLLSCFVADNGKPVDRNYNVALACDNLAVLFGIDELSFLKTDENQKYITIAVEEISKLFLHICATLSLFSSLYFLKQNEKMLRRYRHDCRHFEEQIKHNNRYLFCENISSKKKDRIYSDIELSAIALRHLSTNIGFHLCRIQKARIDDSNTFDLQSELTQLQKVFRLELRSKRLNLLVNAIPDGNSFLLKTNQELFGLMLYNIFDNAVKYSYWGTNISIEITPECLIIKNFGIDIEHGAKPYDVSGYGIGLYVSKKLQNY